MPDLTVFEALRDDHEIQRSLADELVQTEGDSDSRAAVFDRLKTEMAAHADAEERFFYIPLMEHDLTQDKARHSVAEHHELEELIEDLEEKDRSSAGWLTTAKDLRERLTHHLDEEEREVFQMAGKALTETAKADLAASYRGEMNRQRGEHA
ncbi:hemerythrin domain-containing protein [Actinospongicola halichondriae]|uniref:hemerythrin domain-containing protein n=1 Tax=Actinospongicola halichondriae TaxID=3236844 RepID=UPI003D49A5CE